MRVNYLCVHDLSDEDCYKCTEHGITLDCTGCPDFVDVRSVMSAEMLKQRRELMEKLGRKDVLEFGKRP